MKNITFTTNVLFNTNICKAGDKLTIGDERADDLIAKGLAVATNPEVKAETAKKTVAKKAPKVAK
jgi:hypothetical protein